MSKPSFNNTIVFLVVLGLLSACGKEGPQQDEAKRAGKTTADFPEAAEYYFKGLDGYPNCRGGNENDCERLTEDEIKGQNTWAIWTGGNQAFWDYLANNSFGTFDLLKALSSYPCTTSQKEIAKTQDEQYGQDKAIYKARYGKEMGKKYPSYSGEDKAYYRYYKRDTRFRYLGLMNEPGFKTPTKPDKYGLCLDERVAPPEPFDEAVYGKASGVVGLRIYPNPSFDQKRFEQEGNGYFDADKFYTVPEYYNDPNLVRPYRVGMSCTFCHVSHHPLYPPEDPENPKWRNLSATIGAQYFWFGRIFAPNVTPDNLIWHIVDSAQPGAVDTSFLPTDYINNPRAMNAVFDIPARARAAEQWHTETATGGALNLPEVKSRGPTFPVPRILWGGADSVGIDAALTRVYINIGEYHQEWLRHIRPLIGGKPQSPIEVKVAQEHSVYWNATQERAGNLAKYLIRVSQDRMYLKHAPGGEAHLGGGRDAGDYEAVLTQGKIVFAENCARCHSSKLPDDAPKLNCGDKDYLKCWSDYWMWTESPEFKTKIREIVLKPDFLANNYLSTDARIPVNWPSESGTKSAEPNATRAERFERAKERAHRYGTLETEICSAMASNAIEGHVWDNFSSQTYKNLPAVGDVELHDPVGEETFVWSTPGGGRGYQRVPSLIAVWATAPLLHNNEIGLFTSDPSVDGRMRAFDDAIRKLLWPGSRENIVRIVREKDDYDQPIESVYLKVSTNYLPGFLQPLLDENFFARLLRRIGGLGWLVGEGTVQVGPIPKGTPVGLISNINLELNDPRVEPKQLVKLLIKAKRRFNEIYKQGISDDEEAVKRELRDLGPLLRQLSTCPDFEADRGHYFGANLSDQEKEALIAFVKTF